MNFIKLYHSVFDLQLTPNAFRTYCSVLRYMNLATNYANVSQRKLAAASFLSVSSISRGLGELDSKGLLRTIIKKGRENRRLANGYLVTKLEGRFTKLPAAALALQVKSSCFMLYAYLCKCADKTGRAFPSLKQLKAATRLSMSTVINGISALCAMGLARKRHYIKKDTSYGHNQYQIIDCPSEQPAGQKERACLQRMPLQMITAVIYTVFSIICLVLSIVKRLQVLFTKCLRSFLKRGTANLAEQVLDPSVLILEKE